MLGWNRRRSLRVSGLIVLGIAVAASGRLAQAQPFIYTMNLTGKVCVNGTELDNMSSSFDDDDFSGYWEAWADLAVQGSDRYAIRRDGRIFVNGEKFDTLPWDEYYYQWTRIAVADGVVYSLRQDGLLAANDDPVANLPADRFYFTSVAAGPGGKVYSLRSNGNVYPSGSSTPIYKFRAGDGVYDFEDGEEIDTVWVSLKLSPADGNLYALRADGYVYRGVIPPVDGDDNGDDPDDDGEEVTRLAFAGDIPLYIEDLYVDIELNATGGWRALRANGEVYADFRPLSPIVDLPGNASDLDSLYADLAILGEDFWSLRTDGRVYENTNTTEIFRVNGDLHVRIEVSLSAPELTNFKNQKPVAAIYTTTTVVGTPIAVPVEVTDTDKSPEDIIVTPVEPLPPGSEWDPETRTFRWDAPGPKGNYKFEFTLDDGVNKPVKAHHTFKVKDPDAKPDKNKNPYVCKIKKAQALVGFEINLPIVVDDPDGDPLSVTVDTSAYPFSRGATFDPVTRTFSWTPESGDIGKQEVVFLVSDGVKLIDLKVKIEVLSALIFETPE